MRTVALILIGLIGLSACGQHKAILERDRIHGERKAAIDSARELDPIRGKVWMDGFDKDPPLSMLTLSEKPTEAEKPAIQKWHEINLAHNAKTAAYAEQYLPLTVGMVKTFQSNFISQIVELYSQNLSYGEYNRKSKEEYVKFTQQWSALELELARIQATRQPVPKSSFRCHTAGSTTYCD